MPMIRDNREYYLSRHSEVHGTLHFLRTCLLEPCHVRFKDHDTRI